MVALNDAYAKLASLSEERARRVVELIDDLAELEAMENAEDLAAAQAALADGEAPVARGEVVEFPDFAARARRNWGESWRGATSDELLDESRGDR
jgi:hypothetical protein